MGLIFKKDFIVVANLSCVPKPASFPQVSVERAFEKQVEEKMPPFQLTTLEMVLLAHLCKAAAERERRGRWRRRRGRGRRRKT